MIIKINQNKFYHYNLLTEMTGKGTAKNQGLCKILERLKITKCVRYFHAKIGWVYCVQTIHIGWNIIGYYYQHIQR